MNSLDDTPRPAEFYGIGVDLGGTKVGAVLIDPNGAVISQRYLPHDGIGEAAIAAAVAIVEEFVAASPGPATVGFAAAGLVDRTQGDIVHGVLLGIRGAALSSMISDRLGVRLLIENDANATLASIVTESQDGRTALLVALGTGVGGAVSVGGVVVEGSSGFAGEIGHIPVEAPGRHHCPCGSSGCLELFASGTAVAALAATAGIPGAGTTSPRAEDVVRAAAAGDPAAQRILQTAGTAVGTALVGLINALDPAVVYIAGGFGHGAAPYLIPAIAHRISAQQAFADSRPPPRILLDPLGPIAAAVGAARLAQRRAHSHTSTGGQHR